MLKKVFKKIFGTRNDRVLKRLQKTVIQINALEPEYEQLSDEQLRNKTNDFKARLRDGEQLDTLIPGAFAAVREASRRTLGLRHFDEQLIGGMVLNDGKISEMRTGEGKTLVATLSAYLNALTEKGVHIITVNDYLARRDADWMGQIYTFLGLTVGVIVSGMEHEEKQVAYAADITFGTNNEFGFDYLRDNMAFSEADRMQRKLNYAIVDEVDSILIDEARTPLIISGPTNDNSELYQKINKIVPKLKVQLSEDEPADFTMDEKVRQAHLTEQGHEHIEQLLVDHDILDIGESLYDTANISLMHHIDSALRAHFLYQKDVHYVVENDEVVIVDEFTGRKMSGRRWSEGLHQAIEAKEGVLIQNENQTLASITFQNYFRLYNKLSGMTGTADTEAYEFQQIYGLEVVVVPTHLDMIRDDQVDQIFLTQVEKFQAIIEDIEDCIKRKQPVLVGTASIEASEHLSSLLKKENIKHEVLNAKQHQREALIIVQAGCPGGVTIATNMAGRGTDIVLGGNLEAELKEIDRDDKAKLQMIKDDWKTRHETVIKAGGLRIVGTERHESRRIDNQLRGRAGRQGDAGSSRFYLSLEDNLMRIFASERVASIMQRIGMQEGEAISHPWVSKAIENAQRKVEAHNFDIRKNVLEYDDVANDQRKVIYQQRSDLMETNDISETIDMIRRDVVDSVIDQYIAPNSMEEQWDTAGLEEALEHDFNEKLPIQHWLDNESDLNEELLRERIHAKVLETYKEKESLLGTEQMHRLEKAVMLQVLDGHWKEHLAAMDYLRQSIGLRGYAQKNPKQEYKREAFTMFSSLLDGIKSEVARILARIHFREDDDVSAIRRKQGHQKMQFNHPQAQSALQPGERQSGGVQQQPFVRTQKKIGRNEPCFCGSGKKYKQCHGKLG